MGTLTWLDYYLAVKRGDLDTVRAAADKDFRITLSMDKSAMELAALFGHLNLVEYFLSQCDQEKDFGLLTLVLKDGLRGGHLDIVQLLWDFIDDLSHMMGDFVLPAMDGRNLECVKLVNNMMVRNPSSSADYVRKAFEIGSYEMLMFLKDHRRLDWEDIVRAVDLCTWFLDIAWKKSDQAMEQIKKHSNSWFNKKIKKVEEKGGIVRRGLLESQKKFYYFSPLDLAGHFGHLEILKTLIHELETSKPEGFDLEKELDSVIKFALRNNQKHVLEYLIDDAYVKPKPPFEYEGFKINEAFYYLKEKTKDRSQMKNSKVVRENILDCLKVIWRYEDSPIKRLLDSRASRQQPSKMDHSKFWREDRGASRLTEIEEFYDELLEYFSENDPSFCKSDLSNYFMRALAEQNVDAALSIRKRMAKVDCSTEDYHELFEEALCHSAMEALRVPKFEFIPSPVVIELLMDTMTNDGSCSCGKLNPMDLFIVPYHPDDADDVEEVEKDQLLPLDLLTRRAEVVAEVMVSRGVQKPTFATLQLLFDCTEDVCGDSFFQSWQVASTTAARALCALRCTKVKMSDIDIKFYITFWFLKKWTPRDKFLTDFLIALCGNGWQSCLKFECLMLYFVLPKGRTEHFLYCLEQTGLKIIDEEFKSENWDDEGDFRAVMPPTTVEKVLPLRSLTRLAIHRQCLNVAASSSAYTTVQAVVRSVCEVVDYPPLLREFLEFSDVYAGLGFRAPRRLVTRLIPPGGGGLDFMEGMTESDQDESDFDEDGEPNV